MRRPPDFGKAALLAWIGYDLAKMIQLVAVGASTIADLLVLSGFMVTLVNVARRPRPLATRVDGVAFAACALSLGAMSLAVRLADVPYRPTSASDAVILLAAALLFWSTLALGRCFSVLPIAIGAVAGGPYALIRHPLYASYLLVSLGILLSHPHPVVVCGLVAEATALFWRATIEEGLLRQALPDYDRYCRHVRARFVPGLV